MNITLTIPDSAAPAVQARVEKYNAGSGQPPITIEQWRQLQSDEQTAQEVAQLDTAIRAALAQNEDLVAIGKEVAAASPKKQAAAIAAARKALK